MRAITTELGYKARRSGCSNKRSSLCASGSSAQFALAQARKARTEFFTPSRCHPIRNLI
jgi:hypothetical protein